MKILTCFCVAALLCGCNKPQPQAPVPLPPPVPPAPAKVQFEYDVQIIELDSLGDSVAEAESNLAKAQNDLAHAEINQQIAASEITDSVAHSNGIEADGRFYLTKFQIQEDRECFWKTNLLGEINNLTTNDWHLIALLPSETPQKYLAVLKREK